MTTLKITVGKEEHLEKQAFERLQAAADGAELADAQPVLNFESYEDMSRILQKSNLELLETIAEHEPASMREAAKLVDRDIKDVHRNLTELAALNIIDLKEDGKAKRPCVRYDTIEIEVSLRSHEADSALA